MIVAVKKPPKLASAALMVIMPDEIDHIIEGLLGLFGVSKIVGGNGERK
jgi:hypothetical protein